MNLEVIIIKTSIYQVNKNNETVYLFNFQYYASLCYNENNLTIYFNGKKTILKNNADNTLLQTRLIVTKGTH